MDIGLISRKDAVNCGFSGVMLRGSNYAWDLRKTQPYEFYRKINFNIPIGLVGDCYDRFLIRI